MVARFMLWALTLAGVLFSHSAFATDFEAVVTKVVDGDTIKVDLNQPWLPAVLGKDLGIRLKGVNTPESRSKDPCEKKMGLKAKELAKETIEVGSKTQLKNCTRGKYYRLVCDYYGWSKPFLKDPSQVVLNYRAPEWQSFAKTLIEHKLAHPYDGGTKPKVDWCKESK